MHQVQESCLLELSSSGPQELEFSTLRTCGPRPQDLCVPDTDTQALIGVPTDLGSHAQSASRKAQMGSWGSCLFVADPSTAAGL